MSSKIKSLRVSTKLMLVNAVILIGILLLTSLLTIAGLYFSVYHQAEMDLQHSITEVRRSMERSEVIDCGCGRTTIPNPVSTSAPISEAP